MLTIPRNLKSFYLKSDKMMIYSAPNPRRLTLQLRGKALWADEILAALAVVIDQNEFVAREKQRSEIKNGFLKNLERRIKAYEVK